MMGTGEMWVLHQHSYWGWSQIMKWWRGEQKRRHVEATKVAKRDAEVRTQPPKRQRTLMELWGPRGRRDRDGIRQRPERKPPDAAGGGLCGKRRARSEEKRDRGQGTGQRTQCRTQEEKEDTIS